MQGGLLAYGTTVANTWLHMPLIADKILKGASPGDVPVEVVTRRELVVDLTTAREIAMEIPPQVLRRADRTID
jgi:putative ABC transport system substrate-binding protein